MRAGFGLPCCKGFLKRVLRRHGLAALVGLLFALQPLSGVDAQSPQRPRVQSGAAAKPKPAAKKPDARRAPVKKVKPATPKPAATPKPSAPVIAPTPQTAPEEQNAAPSPPSRASVDVDVDKLTPYNLPPASREKMRQCGDEWRKLKLAGQATGQTWRLFAEKCIPR